MTITVVPTRGMNVQGRILIHLPKLGKYSVNNTSLFWVRARVREISPDEQKGGMRPYKLSPRLRKLAAAAWGAAIPATQAQVVTREYLGQSDGSPGQRFHLMNTPILERTPDERLVVEVEGDQVAGLLARQQAALFRERRLGHEGKAGRGEIVGPS